MMYMVFHRNNCTSHGWGFVVGGGGVIICYF